MGNLVLDIENWSWDGKLTHDALQMHILQLGIKGEWQKADANVVRILHDKCRNFVAGGSK